MERGGRSERGRTAGDSADEAVGGAGAARCQCPGASHCLLVLHLPRGGATPGTQRNDPAGSTVRPEMGEKPEQRRLLQDTPIKLPLKRCSVVGNGGILKNSRCGEQIDEADFVMRCNLPPLSREYTDDVGTKTQLVTVNPSIIDKRFQNLLWSRKSFVESVSVYKQSYVYMPAFSTKRGTDPSLRVYYTLEDFGTNQTVLFANPNFLRNVGKFWKSKGVHSKRLSTGLFMVSAALSLCEEVTIYGFWPFQMDLGGRHISHHYYDNMLPLSGVHAMPEEFLQLWHLHKSGVLQMQLDQCKKDVSSKKPH
ncbi:alpha-N-acetylneuraminide alpha-2,8-sialyltransferase isoform X1 [Xenopus laevis]|uniref:Alpha-N-acetylneuraminide alpha-2,8-sialyltransferase isoform X1 n=2 Tax=Xenopus laevis TaxID=8355 RepID=A0A8J1MHS8_XENLA|nr:alpha-N-acetylneuraminide alpha-2,8-sialyltransferase isoform X1 [Xenopus laevis]